MQMSSKDLKSESHICICFFSPLSSSIVCVCVVVVVVEEVDFFLSSEKIKKKRKFPGGPMIRTRCFHSHASGFDPWLGNIRLHRPLLRGLFPGLHLTKMPRIKFGKTIY